MNRGEITASSNADALAVLKKDDLQMDITIKQELKSSIVYAGCNGIISEQKAEDLIEAFGLRAV